MRKLKTIELMRKTPQDTREAEKLPLHVVLDNVRSLHNVGAVFRTADAFLINGISLCGITGAPPKKEIEKTALGATETVNWKYYQTTEEAVATLREGGYQIVVVEQCEGGTRLEEYKASGPVAIVFGHEVNGVGDTIVEKADEAIEIPQHGSKHSLNVSVAAGIVIHHLASLLKRA